MSEARALESQGSAGFAPAEPRGAYFYMDAMRAVFALVVAYGHVWALLIRDRQPSDGVLVQPLYYAAGFGHQAVILFFVLSGFWITRTVVRGAGRGWSWRAYLVDRLTRLMPVLVPALLLGGVLDAIGVFALETPTHLCRTDTYVLRTDVAANLSWEVLLGNLAFLQFYIAPYGSNGPLWSLAYEFWFYIWFPALWLALRYRRPSIALATLAFAWFVPLLALAFLSWLCGAAVFGIAEYLKGRRMPSPAVRRALLGATGLLLAAALIGARFGADTWKDPALALVFSAFLLAVIVADPRPRTPVSPIARYGAQASFSFYATHFPVMAFAAGLAIGAERLAPDAAALGLVAAVLLGSVALAWLFARHTEAHTGALRRLLLGRGAAPAVSPRKDP